MRVWYDTEFLEDGKTIELISIGMVAEDGREYYAINSDAPWDRIKDNDWLVRNVLTSLPMAGRTSLDTYIKHPSNVHPRPSIALVEVDTSDSRVRPHWVIANEVRDFLTTTDDLELWAWYGAYDHVALAQLWGPMIGLPKGVPMWTNDLRQEVHRLDNPQMPEQPSGLHNALEDARHLRNMHEHLSVSAADPTAEMSGVWTAIIVDQTGGIHTAPTPDPEPYHRIMVVRALLDVADVHEIQHQQVLYEAQGWKDPAAEWAEAQAVAAALNASHGRPDAR